MMQHESLEVNFDGLIGPNHNFAGLAPGNLASQAHREQTSHPRAAALQGLAKMQLLVRLGVPQGILPPQPRPNLELLRRLGFRGDDSRVIRSAHQEAPHLLAIAMSGSSMWTANAATVCPSSDSSDGRVHFTPANLVTSLHRASETSVTANILQSIFASPKHFVHHLPLPSSTDMGDEGAANHTRFCDSVGVPGVHLFVYGSEGRARADSEARRFNARQTRLASESVARLHGLGSDRIAFAKQHPDAVDAGVFHNDVIAVGHCNTLLCHELAYVDRTSVYDQLRRQTDGRIRIEEVSTAELSLANAVSTYLFNSQVVTSVQNKTVLIAPQSCRDHESTRAIIDRWIARGAIDDVNFVDVVESMANGGGPACLRLRVVLTKDERDALSGRVLLDDDRISILANWISRHYRETLMPSDLGDPNLFRENEQALDELTQILELGSIYEFQR